MVASSYSQSMDDSVSQKVAHFFCAYRKRILPKGQIIIYAGDTSQDVHYIVSGRVKQYDISYRGDEVILNIFKNPAFFPMSLAISKRPSVYFFETEEETIVHVAPADDVIKFLHANPDIMFDLLSRIYTGVDGLLGRMAHLMAGSARSRLIYEIILQVQRFGSRAKDGTYSITLSEKDLGARSGLSRETVNREMHKLQRDNIVKISRSVITIRDMESLSKALGKDLARNPAM